jgi:predicted tellurium resistance membrane protein TerC
MNFNKLFDLRFVIGSFFLIVGILLVIYGFLIETEHARKINKWCGITFSVFGIIMIVLSLQKEAHDELLEDDNRVQ